MANLNFQLSRLIMGEPVPFGQRYTYPTSHPIDAVKAAGYFRPARTRLRAGDTIRVVQLADPDYAAPTNWVMGFVDLMVTEVSDVDVKVAEERPGASVPKPKATKAKAPEREPERYIEADGAEVVEEDDEYVVELNGEKLARLKDLAQANAIAAGDAPLPR